MKRGVVEFESGTEESSSGDQLDGTSPDGTSPDGGRKRRLVKEKTVMYLPRSPQGKCLLSFYC